ncbi:DJ-1/PfpI family protein [Sanguibacter suaedae]|uniref:DJ-1/PfpI family protein n=1 Tax=Sanguibacter suaedae TaxID=2795737 RepID=A0A934IAC1_9MICO|nr:DJ-1/PfpI family protein [Sanguibacter suaedae]MBI9114263.1 DJ-1/PfpI family protein [Sanguibacter suaedae]
MSTGGQLRIGLYVFDDAEELDVVGPYAVLVRWAGRSALHPQVMTFSDDGAGVRLSHGLRLVPDCSWEDVEPLHVLVHPGGPGATRLMADSDHLARVRDARARVPLLVSVCTGSLVLAAAGLLAGRAVAAHRDHVDLLSRAEPGALVDGEARYVDDGDLVTTSGTSAGVDAALHLVSRFEGEDLARDLGHELQHDPWPPA